jgi:hypothetical protein
LKKKNHRTVKKVEKEIVATSLDGATGEGQILELYQMRWTIELAFKRLISLFHYNKIPSKLDATAKAWVYGKLPLAAICEAVTSSGRFPPAESKTSAKEWSLWKELEISLVLVNMLAQGALDWEKIMRHRLSAVCANSKRKRLPALWCFLSSA